LLNKRLSFGLTDLAVQEGIKNAYWPGRTEILSREPLLVMDGAHNKEGIEALLHTINRKFSNRRIHFLFAAVDDKDLSGMVHLLEEKAESISFSTFDMPRAAKSEELLDLSQHPNKQTADPIEWVTDAVESKTEDAYIMTGSLYFLSSLLPKIKGVLSNENKK